MFRVSPWITYDPAPEARQEGLTRTNNHFYNMPDDVEMDAPQISTLRDEDTPEPQDPTPARTSKFRVKLLVNENSKTKKAAGAGASSSRKQAAPTADSEDDDEDEDDEEDQLIDDDDEEAKTAAPSTVPSPEKRVTTTKRGTTTGRGRGRGRGRGKAALARGGALSAGSAANAATGVDVLGAASASTPVVQKTGRGRGRGGGRGRKRGAKATSILIPPHVVDDAGSMISDSAASSPIAHDDHSPEPPDFLSHAHSTISIAPAPSTSLSSISTTVPMMAAPEEINLEGIPLPVYPLPMKPPPVQPPQKIGSGFAPIIPLDKSGKKVRHWRQVKREVRGIAGGRWFTQTWIGEKESEFATAAAAATSALQSSSAMDRENLSALTTAPGMALPKLPGAALTGRGPGRPRIHPKVEASLATNPSSRAQSIASDSLPSAIATKGIKRTYTQMSSAAETPTVSTPIP